LTGLQERRSLHPYIEGSWASYPVQFFVFLHLTNFNSKKPLFGIFAGHTPVVQLLRQHKADTSILNKQGKTAADVAKTPEVAKALTE